MLQALTRWATLLCALALLAGPGAHAETLTATGTVLMPDGEPAAGAEVFVFWFFSNADGEVDQVEAETTTAEDGIFELTVEGQGDSIRSWPVGAMLEGYGLGWTATEPDRLHDLTIRLHEGTTVAGRVVDPTGQPVEGATVMVQEVGGDEDSSDSIYPPQRLASETDADGRYEFPGMPVGKQVRLSAYSSGFAPCYFVRGKAEEMSDREITLEPGGAITGRVVREGEPVPGVRIHARREEGYHERAWATTREDGSFAIDQMKAGIQTVYVDPPESWTAAPVRHVNAPVGEPIDVGEIELIRGGVVNGLVSDRETGEPVTKVAVTAYPSEEDFPFAGLWTTYADADGHYELRLPPGRYWLHGDGRGAGYQYRGDEPWLHEVEVADGQSVEGFDMSLTPIEAHTVTGVVVDEDGRPVEGALVKAAGGVRGEAQTDAEGRFQIAGEGEGMTALLAIDQRRGLVARAVAHSIDDEPRITLGPGAWATIRLVDPEGNGIARQPVNCRYSVWDQARTYGRTLYLPKQFTDQDGRVRLGPLPSRVELEVWWYGAAEFITREDWGEGFTLQPGEERDVGRVVVDRAGATITGRVLDVDGNPVAECLVIDMIGEAETRTDESGRFEVTGLPFIRDGVRPTTAYRAFIVAGLPEGGVYGALPDFEVSWEFPADLALEAPGSLAGRLVGADGTPMAGDRVELSPVYYGPVFRVSASRFGDVLLEGHADTDEDGHFRFDGLIPGVRYRAYWRDARGIGLPVTDEIVTDPGNKIDLGDVSPNQ